MNDMEALPNDYALCLVGHGTRDANGVQEFLTLFSKFKERAPKRVVECGFLELAKPTIEEAISKCAQGGISKILVIPGLLMSAGHAKNDIPAKINEMSRKYPNLNINYTQPLGLHPKIIQICTKRIESAEINSKVNISRSDTLLITVGRGSSDPHANSVVFNTSKRLGENMGFLESKVSFMAASQPLFQNTLKASVEMGFKRIITFPYFLFTGVLVNKIVSIVDNIQKKYPGIEFLKANHLNYDELLIDVFVERAREIQYHLPALKNS